MSVLKGRAEAGSAVEAHRTAAPGEVGPAAVLVGTDGGELGAELAGIQVL